MRVHSEGKCIGTILTKHLNNKNQAEKHSPTGKGDILSEDPFSIFFPNLYPELLLLVHGIEKMSIFKFFGLTGKFMYLQILPISFSDHYQYHKCSIF